MLNQEFQELKRLLGINSIPRSEIISKMKQNLIDRNNGKDEYSFGYTKNGKSININSIEKVEDLLSIDGDMNPQGL